MYSRLRKISITRYECSFKDALPTIEGKGGGNKKSARGGGKAIMSGDEFLNQLVSSLQSAV